LLKIQGGCMLLRFKLETIVRSALIHSLKHKNTQPLCIYNKENPQNSEPQNGPMRGLDCIALQECALHTQNGSNGY